MAKDKFDYKEWLKGVTDGVDLPADQRKLLEDTLGKNESLLKNLEGTVMLRSDYSRRQNELAEERKGFESDQKKIKTDYDKRLRELATWEGTAKEKLEASENARKEAEQKLVDAQRRYKARLSGDDPDELEDPDDLDRRKHSDFDPDKYATELEARFQKRLEDAVKAAKEETTSAIVGAMAPYPIQLNSLATNHRKLFGEELDLTDLYKKSQETGRPMDELWAKQYKVDERRAEMAEEAITKRIEEARSDERRKTAEEFARPQAIEPEQFGSAAARRFIKKAETPEELSAVERAVLAHRDHKHAPPTSPHWKGNQQSA